MKSKYFELIGVVFLMIFCVNDAFTQCDLCDSLAPNVVRVSTSFDEGEDENGFGFIVGEENDMFFIVTANHVVSSENGAATEKVDVTFYGEKYKSYSATPIQFNSSVDLALLQVSKPDENTWQTAFVDTLSKEGDTVYFIGRNQSWYVPNYFGFISRIDAERRIVFEHLSVQQGCSGAPLVTNNGIIGIITEASPGESFGLHIALITDIIETDWGFTFQGSPYISNSKEKKIVKVFHKMSDVRDGKTYKTVKIGRQIWMAENLNYDAGSGCWCYDNDNSNCDIYGRLYNFNATVNACPEGWHVPGDVEWQELVNYLGNNAGGKLKAISTWVHPNVEANNQSGFNALPAGVRNSNSRYSHLGSYGYFWSSTKMDNKKVWARSLYGNTGEIYRTNWKYDFGLSIRCVHD